jgi:hypothetical protein
MKYKLTPGVSEDQSVSQGQTLVVNLPRNSIVDLSTFAWFFAGKTNEAGWALPKHIETIIDRLQVLVNNQVVDGGFKNYNLLFRRLADLTLGDKDTIRGVLQNTQGASFTNFNGGSLSNWAYATAVDAGSNNLPQQFCIDKWLGFLGSAQPQCIDTSILGDVAIHITLAGSHVLSRGTNAPGTTGTYTLTNNYFSIDCISLNDGVYYDIVNQRLGNAENPIQIPFQSWSYFSPGNTGLSQTTTGTLSTESLDLVVGTISRSNWANNTYDTDLMASSAFATGSSNITTSSFIINNVPYPSYEQQVHDVFESTQQAFNLATDTLGGTDPNLKNLTTFRNKYFIHALRLNHPTSSDERVLSGMNLRGTNASIQYKTTGNEANVVPHLFCGQTQVMNVGAYKQIQVNP